MAKLAAVLKDARCREDFRQLVLFGLGYGVVLVLGYVLLRQINLSLSPEEMGRFSYAVSAIGLSAAVLYFGGSQAYLRFHDNHRIAVRLRRCLLPLYAVAAVAVAGIAWWVTGSAAAVAYAAVPFFFERVHILRARMESMRVNALKILELLVPIALLLVFRENVTAARVMCFYGLGYAMCWLFPTRADSRVTSPDVKTLGRFLGPVLLTTLVAMVVEHLTVVATKTMLGYEAAAQMGVAARNLIFLKALFSFLQMFYPVVYFREMKNARYGVVRLYRMLLVGVSLVATGAMVAGAPLLYRVTGANRYVQSSPVFVSLAIAAMLDFLFEMTALYFQYEIKTWKATLVKVSFLGVLLSGFAILPTLQARWTDVDPVLIFAGIVLAAAVASDIPGLVWALAAERRHRKERT